MSIFYTRVPLLSPFIIHLRNHEPHLRKIYPVILM